MARLKRSKYISRDTVYINVYQKYTVCIFDTLNLLEAYLILSVVNVFFSLYLFY